jgi:hypothetical protein
MATVYQAGKGGETPQSQVYSVHFVQVFPGMPAIALPGMNMPRNP